MGMLDDAKGMFTPKDWLILGVLLATLFGSDRILSAYFPSKQEVNLSGGPVEVLNGLSEKVENVDNRLRVHHSDNADASAQQLSVLTGIRNEQSNTNYELRKLNTAIGELTNTMKSTTEAQN